MMRKWFLFIATIVIMATLAGCLGGGDERRTPEPEGFMAQGQPIHETGYCGAPEESDATEPSTVNLNIDLNETEIKEVAFKLTWADDEPSSDPDTFRLSVDSNSTNGEISGDVGLLTLEFPGENSTGSDVLLDNIWKVTVECVESGDEWVIQTPWGTGIYYADLGNSWTLDINFKYMKYEE